MLSKRKKNYKLFFKIQLFFLNVVIKLNRIGHYQYGAQWYITLIGGGIVTLILLYILSTACHDAGSF